MAIYGISFETTKFLSSSIEEFKNSFLAIIDRVARNFVDEAGIRAENAFKGLGYGTQVDAMISARHKVKPAAQYYYDTSCKILSTHLQRMRKTLKLIEDFKFSTIDDRGYQFVFDFGKGTLTKTPLADRNAAPSVTIKGFSVAVQVFEMYGVDKRDPILNFPAKSYKVDFDRLDIVYENIRHTTLKEAKKIDLKGKEYFRRLFAILSMVATIGMVITYTQEFVFEPNYSTFYLLLFVFGILGAFKAFFNIKRKAKNNIVFPGILLVLGIALSIFIKVSNKKIAAITAMGYILVFAIIGIAYNVFFRRVSKEYKANKLAPTALVLANVVEIIMGAFIGLCGLGILSEKTIRTAYLPFLPIMAILIFFTLIGTLINAGKHQIKQVEEGYDKDHASKKREEIAKRYEELVSRLCTSMTKQSDIFTFKYGAFKIQYTFKVSNRNVLISVNGVAQLNARNDMERYEFIKDLNNKLSDDSLALTNALIRALNEYRKDLKEFEEDSYITFTLGSISGI